MDITKRDNAYIITVTDEEAVEIVRQLYTHVSQSVSKIHTFTTIFGENVFFMVNNKIKKGE